MARAGVFSLLLVFLPCRGMPSENTVISPISLAASASPRFDAVQVANTRTSIYIGSVSLSMPAFRREGISYRSTYISKAFPYFFYNEKGRLAIDIPDEDLARLAKGETIHFSGHAESTKGDPRRIEGRAIPENAFQGKIKVRVFVTPKIELIFNTTYRFTSPDG